MPNKRASYEIATFKADERDGHRGEFEAIVSVFGNVDHMGDRVVKGAFRRTLANYRKSGDPIPVIWSHDWADPFAHIGTATATETDTGLKVKAKLDIDDNPNAAQVFRLMKERRVKEFSFGYGIAKEQTAEDGANELLDLDLLEVGPTLKGMNPATELLAVKQEAEMKAGRRRSRADEVELRAIREDHARLGDRIDRFIGADDDDDEPEKSQTADEEPTGEVANRETEQGTVTDEEPQVKSDDGELLLEYEVLIEKMRQL